MAVKTFHEILSEKLQRQEPPKASPEAKTFQPALEFDLSTVQFGQTLFRPKGVYPRNEVKPAARPAPVKPAPPADKVIATSHLTAAEKLALRSLEIVEEALLSRNEVKNKHRALVRKFHPDRHPAGLSELERRLLTEKFQLIQESYQMLEEAFRRHIPKQQ